MDSDLQAAVRPGGEYLTVPELARANEASGGYWFSPGTLGWFETLDAELYGGRFLVASEAAYTGRVWRVAYCEASGRIDYLPAPEGSDQASLAFASYKGAQLAAGKLEAGRPPVERLDYDAHLACSRGAEVDSYASWLVAGEPLCHQHAGAAITSGWGGVL